MLLKAPVGIANFLMNQKREHIAQIEVRYGLSVRIEGDPTLISPDYSLEKFKTATRVVPPPSAHVVSVDTSLMDEVDADDLYDDDEDEDESAEDQKSQTGEVDGDGKPKRRRRRRRRSRSKSSNGDTQTNGYQNGDDRSQKTDEPASPQDEVEAEAEEPTLAVTTDAGPSEPSDQGSAKSSAKPKSTRSRSRKPKAESVAAEKTASEDATAAEAASEEVEVSDESAPKAKPKPKRTRSTKSKSSKKTEPASDEPVSEEATATATPEEDAGTDASATELEPALATDSEAAEAKSDKPKRKGWWSIGT